MRLRVLLVDDEIELRELWSEILELKDYDVAQAGSLADVHALLASGHHFDIAVVDWSLPDGRGTDVRAALTAGGDALPVIYASGFGPMLPAGHGGDGVLAKPFRTKDLITLIERLVAQQ